MMTNGQAKTKTNGQSGPAKAALSPAPAKPPASPFAFADELPTKVRDLVESATKAAKADTQRAADTRYVDGMRRGAFLISMALGELEGTARQAVMKALEQLETEVVAAEKVLRAAAK